MGAADESERRGAAGPTQPGGQLLGVLLWLKLVTYRPYLLAVIAPQDVLREVDGLAGQVTDLLTAEGHARQQDGIVGAANEVLDTCRRFGARWNGQTRRSQAFEADVGLLRSRLSRIVHQLSTESVVADRRVS